MNARAIRKRLERELRHAPEVKDWRDEFFDRLNDAIVELMTMDDWQFRQRTKQVRVYPEIAGTPTLTVNASGEQVYKVAAPDGWLPDEDTAALEGHTVEITGTFTSGVFSTDETRAYVIERAAAVVDAGVVYLECILDPTYPGNANVSMSAGKIQFLRYTLTDDIEDVYGLIFRDKDAGVHELSPRQETALNLQADDTGSTPRYFILDPNKDRTYKRYSGQFYPHDFISPPLGPPAVVPLAGGALTALGTYEYRYAWAYGGLVSEPSPSTTVTLAAGEQQVRVTMEFTDAGRGRTRYLYRRQVYDTYEGPWFRIHVEPSSNTASHTDAGTFAASGVDPSTVIRERRYDSDGSPRFYRLWPTTTERLDAELRYLARLPRVETDADVPEFPGAFHIVLVHLMAAKIARGSEAASLADYHHQKVFGADGLLDTMRQRHKVSAAQRYMRRKMFGYRGTGIVAGPLTYTADG